MPQQLPLSGEPFLTIVVDDEPRLAFAGRGVDVVEDLYQISVRLRRSDRNPCHFHPVAVHPSTWRDPSACGVAGLRRFHYHL
jgi:hypothetical protein